MSNNKKNNNNYVFKKKKRQLLQRNRLIQLYNVPISYIPIYDFNLSGPEGKQLRVWNVLFCIML